MDLDNNFKDRLAEIYGDLDKIISAQTKRYTDILKKHSSRFSSKELSIFSSPGRIEIGGNHTDHNNGRVIAAAINLDAAAAVSKTDNNTITLYSDGFEKPFIINCSDLKIKTNEYLTTNALIRGIVSKFIDSGYKTGGFDAYVNSDVGAGLGLSSSACFEILIAEILNDLYNDGKIKPLETAIIGRFAENFYFNKPCGLMDQTACAFGGIITIDFKNQEKPVIEKINYDFSKKKYSIIVVNTGNSHADLTEEYALIPREMKLVAGAFNKKVCRELKMNDIINKIDILRKKGNDRAVLRAIHFLMENERVEKEISALKNDDLNLFFKMVNESGDSSWKYLQNIYPANTPFQQGMSIALALTDIFIKNKASGACRVHGGGFGGTIIGFLPENSISEYSKIIEKSFGKNSLKVLKIRERGAMRIV